MKKKTKKNEKKDNTFFLLEIKTKIKKIYYLIQGFPRVQRFFYSLLISELVRSLNVILFISSIFIPNVFVSFIIYNVSTYINISFHSTFKTHFLIHLTPGFFFFSLLFLLK